MMIVKQLPFPIVAPSEHSENLLILLATTRIKVADDDDGGSSDTYSVVLGTCRRRESSDFTCMYAYT
jgi:hypothetical protein